MADYPSPTFQTVTLVNPPASPMQVVNKGYVDGIVPAASSALPKAEGTAASGVATAWSRADHVHPASTGSISSAMLPVVGASTVVSGLSLLGGVAAAGGNVSAAVATATGGTTARTMAAFTADVFNVKSFGAIGNGITDDTAAIQATINAAMAVSGTVYLPSGTYKVSTTLAAINAAKMLVIKGAGKTSTTIVTANATGDVLSLALAMHDVRDLTIGSSVARTGYSHILAKSNIGNLTSICIDNYMRGITAQDNGGTFQDVLLTNPALNATGVVIDGYIAQLTIDNLNFYQGVHQAAAGIQIVSCGCMLLNNSNIVGQGIDLFINPSSGTCAAIFCENTFFDTAAQGIVISATGSGSVVRVKFTNCWTCSHTSNGVSIQNNGSGIVGGIEFVNHISSLNSAAAGITTMAGSGAVSGVSIIGGSFAGNSTGIFFAAGVSDFTVMGVQAGAYGGMGGNSNVGIAVQLGASNRYIISNNRVSGNANYGISDGGSGINKFVGNNIT